MIRTLILFLTSLTLSSTTEEYHRNDYTFLYSEKYELPIYVKYTINKSDVNGPFERTNKFKQDKSIPTLSANLGDYRKSGYDRGHMKPAAVSKGSQLDMDQSFFNEQHLSTTTRF